MATKSIQRGPDVATVNTGSHAGIGVDSDDDKLYFNSAGTVKAVVDVSSTQTLTNKTLTSPVITGATGAGLSEVVTATNVITAAESGTTFYLSAVAGFLSTLPAAAAGLKFRFIVKTAPTSNGYTIGTNAGANVFYGMFVERAGTAGVAGAAQDLITLVANQSIIGDFVEVESDGTNWYVNGMVDVAAGATFGVT
jgi:hypothetical protein